MSSSELENLAKADQLKCEPPIATELAGLQKSGEKRLADAANKQLSLESRFDLAYNASHAFALAALRRLGYRSDKRYLAFQVLPHTLDVPASVWRVLAKCHGLRNHAEYEGNLELDEGLVSDLVTAATAVRDALRKAGPPPKK